jgi:hypothetical protein
VAAQRKENLLFSRWRSWPEGDRRNYGLNAFDVDIKFLSKGDELNLAPPIFRESWGFDPKVYTAPKGSLFDGYWQTEKYFDDSLVRSDFKLSTTDWKSIDAIMKAGEKSAFIHVRRGDYLISPHKEYHGDLMETEYYSLAIDYVRERVSDCKFFIFSDDPEWCRMRFPEFAVMEPKIRGAEAEDLALMAICEHAIIANSSFSWFGAWLAPFEGHRKRIVIAPKRWFVGGPKNTQDVVPERWIRL